MIRELQAYTSNGSNAVMCDAVRVTTLEDSMNRWKTIAMMSMGFTCGVVWTAACGGADSAKADDSGYEDDGAAGSGG